MLCAHGNMVGAVGKGSWNGGFYYEKGADDGKDDDCKGGDDDARGGFVSKRVFLDGEMGLWWKAFQ